MLFVDDLPPSLRSFAVKLSENHFVNTEDGVGIRTKIKQDLQWRNQVKRVRI